MGWGGVGWGGEGRGGGIRGRDRLGWVGYVVGKG